MMPDPLQELGSQGLFLLSSSVILLIIIFFLYKTYRSSLNVEARLAEFSSLTDNRFGRKLHLIEVNADEYRLNKKVLGPLARIIDEYCVLTTDQQGIITFANDKFLSLSGYSFQQLIGQPESMNHPQDDNRRQLNRGHTNMKKPGVWSGEVCNRHHDGGTYWMNLFIFPLSYITDEEDGFIYFGNDITAIKHQNNELKQAVRDKEQKISQVESLLLHSEKMASLGTISAGIAHEINNPIAFLAANLNRYQDYLTTLSGVVDGLSRRLPAEKLEHFLKAEKLPAPARLNALLEDYPALMQETHEGIERIKKIIRDLKHFSHQNTETFAPLDMAHCVDMSLNLARHELKNRIRVHKAIPAGLPRVKGSESQLSQVLMNLLVNAAQAIKERGEIHLDASIEDGWYCLSVADNGPGIDAATRSQMFEPFFTTKPIGQGTGLGLSISQDIIQRHGGSLSVDSTREKGTRFRIRLPLDSPASDVAITDSRKLQEPK